MNLQTQQMSATHNPSIADMNLDRTRFSPTSDNSREYRDALGQFATGVTIVTTNGGVGPVGITANSFSSVSLDPALVLWSMSKKSERYASFCNALNFAIHVLHQEQHELAMAFAKSAHAFGHCNWATGEADVPLITDALVCFECRKQSVHDAGDHVIIVGAVDKVSLSKGDPLVFAGGSFGSFLSGA